MTDSTDSTESSQEPDSLKPAGESNEELKTLIRSAQLGDRRAAKDLLPVLYSELRRLGSAMLRRRRPGQTLQATALVHEAYMRLVGPDDPGWDGRGHFFGAAARAMRDILVENARRKQALKRGGDRRRVDMDGVVLADDAPSEDLLALNEALERLEKEDARKGQIITLRFFGGLSVAEVAEVMEVSKATIEREWRYTRAWLCKEMDAAAESE